MGNGAALTSMAASAPLPLTPPPVHFPTPAPTMNVAPLKAMLFIDGTWLYYSLHQRAKRNDAILRMYGTRWQRQFQVDWSALPRFVCEQMRRQHTKRVWSLESALTGTGDGGDAGGRGGEAAMAMARGRPVEVVRASVFTSYKKTTRPDSIRVSMFEEMAKAGYDVHLMETVGTGEKCVNIQLAVEMLHYATVPTVSIRCT